MISTYKARLNCLRLAVVVAIMIHHQVQGWLVLCCLIFSTRHVRGQTNLVGIPWLRPSIVPYSATAPQFLGSDKAMMDLTSASSFTHHESNLEPTGNYFSYNTGVDPSSWYPVSDYGYSVKAQYEPVVRNAKSGAGLKRKAKRKYRKKKPHKKVSKKLKNKIISVNPGSYIPGGNPLPKLFKTAKDCMKACAKMSNCLAGDWNKQTYRCYTHQATACDNRQPHKTITHFSKIPCRADLEVPGTSRVRVYIGVSQQLGVLMKAIKNIQDCIKECLTGGGSRLSTPGRVQDLTTTPQLCFGIDYDFSSHKCYLNLRIDYNDPNVLPNTRRRLCNANRLFDTEYLPLLHRNNNVVAMVFCGD